MFVNINAKTESVVSEQNSACRKCIDKITIDGHLYAIKYFNDSACSSRRFRELHILSRLNHSNIVSLVATGPDAENGLLDFIILEFACCGDLNNLLHHSLAPYNLMNALNWFLQIAQSISYLHDECTPTIVHRDIKPANMLLFNKGARLKLCDFESACLLTSKSPTCRGTYAYMAPELFGSNPEYDEKCDVYGAALTFWEILTRCHCFPAGDSFLIIANKLITEKYRPKISPDCPHILKILIERAWFDEPNFRPSMKSILLFLQTVDSVLLSSGKLSCPLEIPLLKDNSTHVYDSWTSENCLTSEITPFENEFLINEHPTEILASSPEYLTLAESLNEQNSLTVLCDEWTN